MNTILRILQTLSYIIPSLIKIITHYNELTTKGKLQPEDRDKAIALLKSLRWRPFEEIKMKVKEKKDGH
ncbi:MAG: hypothetical protein DDT19_01951 [Syntrophomonadaceae bacterium]|nr:hypothetical protein [Bacillota bacterium]